MYCEKCDAYIDENSQPCPEFCPVCGTPVPKREITSDSDHLPFWMLIAAFLLPPYGWLLSAAYVSKNDNSSAEKLYIASILPVIAFIVIIAANPF